MVTTVTTKPVTRKGTGHGGPSFPGGNGGPRGNGWKGDADNARRGASPASYRIAVWVLLAAIVMIFAALSSAYVVLSSGNLPPIAMPRMFFLSTGIIVVSSLTLESSRQSLREGRVTNYVRWLRLTLFLGLAFLVSQLMGWRELVAQGVYLASNPHSSFFYIFTGVHGVHLLGGIFALTYLSLRSQRKIDQQVTEASAGSVSLYWHAMDALWVWLFLLLLLWK